MEQSRRGEMDLSALLDGMEPELHTDAYVFLVVRNLPAVPIEAVFASVREAEGTTVVTTQRDADALRMRYEFVAARITLTIHSALEAVGLTAAVATALAEAGISCNVLAGYFHDHIFVDWADRERALALLREVSGG